MRADDEPEVIRQPLPQEQIGTEPFTDQIGGYTTQCAVVYADSNERMGVIWGNNQGPATAAQMPEQYLSQFGPEAEISDCAYLHDYHPRGVFHY